jgi:uncharacterized integral membrane protein
MIFTFLLLVILLILEEHNIKMIEFRRYFVNMDYNNIILQITLIW